MTPQELQEMLDELQASRSSRRRAWENLREIRWVLKDTIDSRGATTGKEDDRSRRKADKGRCAEGASGPEGCAYCAGSRDSDLPEDRGAKTPDLAGR